MTPGNFTHPDTPTAGHLIESADVAASRGQPVTFGPDRWQIIAGHIAALRDELAECAADLERVRSTIAWNRAEHERTEHKLRVDLANAKRKLFELVHYGVEP